MYRQLCWLISLVFVLGLVTTVQGADPDLVGWWWFDEAGGTTATDSSGYGNNGTLTGGASWAPGYFNTALELDGVDGYVDVPHDATLTTTGEATVMAWINASVLVTSGESYQGIISKGNGTARSYSLYTTASGMHFSTGPNGSFIGSNSSSGALPTNEWVHVCAMIVDSGHAYFVNGEPAGTSGAGAVGPGAADTENVVIGRTQEGTGRSFTGLMDDVRIYVRGLTQAEIQEIMTGSDLTSTSASEPSPEDGVIDLPRDAVLSWTAGELAATHDVYFGTVADDVNNASRANPMGLLVSQGQTATNYDPDGLLEIGQTYYWRVDEVNAAPDDTIFKGTVWSFTAEPLAYPIEGVVASTNATPKAGALVESMVDGSGLNADDQHSIDSEEMFLGVPGTDPMYLQFEFDQVYKLHEAHVWNYNVQFEAMLGFGLKDVTVEYSTDGADWTVLGDMELAQGTTRPDYLYNTTIEFGGVAAKFVKLTVHSSFGTIGQYGLSEIRFMFIPASAREPQPADGNTGVSVDEALAWRTGRDALSHEVYFGTDSETLALTDTVTTTSYDPGTLDLDTTYYWKVNEIQAIDSWESAVWSFSTQEYLLVEDFESYIDDEGSRIYETWLDGYDIPANGSTVGNLDAPFAEMTIVNGGRQSMPLFYENSGTTISEAEYTFGAENWATGNVKSLSLYFHGATGNNGQLYLKINNTKVLYDSDATDIALAQWQTWNVDLSTIGNVSNVTSLTIGIEGAGATGVVYIDDIRLYPRTPEYVTPTEPDTAGLVLQYTFDEGSGTVATDSSGNGNNGTLAGDPAWITGASNGALDFDGSRDYVTAGASLLNDLTEFTIACWIKGDLSLGNHSGLIGQNDCIEYGIFTSNNVHIWSAGGGSVDLAWPYGAGADWHHIVAVGDGTAVTIYLDGKPAISGGMAITDTYGASTFPVNIAGGGVFDDADNWFTGQIDEVYVYQRALSAAEVAGLAGRTTPIHMPF